MIDRWSCSLHRCIQIAAGLLFVRRADLFNRAPGEIAMAKGQMRSNKEKKKPKADKNLKKGGVAPVNPFASGKPPRVKAPTARRTDVRFYRLCQAGAARPESARDGVAGEARRIAATVTRTTGDPCQFAAGSPQRRRQKPGSRRSGPTARTGFPCRSPRNASRGCEPLSISRHQQAASVLPIDPRAIRFTMRSTMRVGPNTGGEENG